MWFCMKKTVKEFKRKKKKAILEYVMSSVKLPLHLYNAVAIKEQFPVWEKKLQSTLCYQMVPRRSGMLQMGLLLPGSPCPWGTGTKSLCASQPKGCPSIPCSRKDKGSPGCAGRTGPLLQECTPRHCYLQHHGFPWRNGVCGNGGHAAGTGPLF